MGRTMAAVLFTDLVGSTELRGRLGEEAADELRRRHDQLLTQAVGANNGRVVKGLGDGIMATFAGASDAVAAAVAIQQAIDRLNRSGKALVPLAVRVGLSAGDVAFEDEDVHGTPVIEAARLCAVAEGGRILAAVVVPTLAGLADDELVDCGRLELKGLQKAVAAWEVRWAPGAASAIPLPALLTDVGRVFVGRDHELERLGQLWKEAAAGERRVALLGGEPGVGKTRLAAEVAIRVDEEGGAVLAGRCDEDLGVPYQPFVEALRHYLDHTPDADRKERLGRYGGELGRLIPELSEGRSDLPPPIQSDPETERYRLFDAVASWLSAASAEDPLVLVLDDLQWATKPTLLLLRHLVRSAEPMHLLIVGTYRDTDLGRGHPLGSVLADLRREAGTERVSLRGLDPAAVATYLERAAGHTLDDDELGLARAIYEETEGNPFFVREVVRHLGESGLAQRCDGRWKTQRAITEIGIPESVRDVVGRRLSRLSQEANETLWLASVVGTEFDVSVIQAAGNLADDVLVPIIEEACRGRLTIEASVPGHYRFAHALVRETLYGELSAARRVSLHRRVATAIETLHADAIDEHLAALAHHWARAGGAPANTARAVEYARRAGDRAMTQLAFEAAASHYEQALATVDASDRSEQWRSRLLLALGRAQAKCGDLRAEQAYRSAADVARSTGDAETLAGAALGLADLWAFSSSVDDTRIGLLEEARDALGDATSPTTAQVLARLATELHSQPGTWDRRDELTAQSVEVARRLGDPNSLALSLHARNYAMWAPGGAAERLAAGREIVELAGRGGDPELALHGYAWCQTASLELGDIAALDHALGEYERVADELRQPRYRWYAATRRTMRTLLAGELDRAESMARAARSLGRAIGEADAENVFVAQMCRLWDERPCQEGIDLAAAHCEMAQAKLSKDSALVIAFRLFYLLLLVETPKRQQARAEVEPLVITATARLDPTCYGMGWSILATLVATAAVRLDMAGAVADVYALLLPYVDLNAQNCGAVTFDGAYAHHLGMLATTLERYDDAANHFAVAEATHSRIGAPAWLARTRIEWARMLLTRCEPGDRKQAREFLVQAFATAREFGLGKVERDAAALLQDCA